MLVIVKSSSWFWCCHTHNLSFLPYSNSMRANPNPKLPIKYKIANKFKLAGKSKVVGKNPKLLAKSKIAQLLLSNDLGSTTHATRSLWWTIAGWYGVREKDKRPLILNSYHNLDVNGLLFAKGLTRQSCNATPLVNDPLRSDSMFWRPCQECSAFIGFQWEKNGNDQNLMILQKYIAPTFVWCNTSYGHIR